MNDERLTKLSEWLKVEKDLEDRSLRESATRLELLARTRVRECDNLLGAFVEMDAIRSDVLAHEVRRDLLAEMISRLEYVAEEPAPPVEPVYDLTFSEAVAAMREGKTVERAVDDSAFRRWHIVHDGTLRALSLNGLWELYAITVQDFDARYRVVPEDEDNG